MGSLIHFGTSLPSWFLFPFAGLLLMGPVTAVVGAVGAGFLATQNDSMGDVSDLSLSWQGYG